MNILITGDSWSQGEWNGDWRSTPSTYCVYHSGINQYLQEAGHQVINVGSGSIGNLQALDNLKTQIDNYKFDYLIVFFTDPLRDCTEQEIKSGKLFELLETKTKLFLSQLEKIKLEHADLKIILIGGYAKITMTNDAVDYIIPSIIELLIPGAMDSNCADSPEWKQYLPLLSVFSNVDQKQQIIDFCNQADQKFSIMGQNRHLFYPDGCHPNRHAHRLITDKILTLLTV